MEYTADEEFLNAMLADTKELYGIDDETSRDVLREKIIERDRELHLELLAIKKRVDEMEKLLGQVSPSLTDRCVKLCDGYITRAKNAKNAVKKHIKGAVKYYDAMCKNVHTTNKLLEYEHYRLKESVKQRALHLVDEGIYRIAEVFDKGISFLTKRKQELTHLAPVSNDKREVPLIPPKAMRTLIRNLHQDFASNAIEDKKITEVLAPRYSELIRREDPTFVPSNQPNTSENLWKAFQVAYAKTTGRKDILRLKPKEFCDLKVSDLLNGKNKNKAVAR